MNIRYLHIKFYSISPNAYYEKFVALNLVHHTLYMNIQNVPKMTTHPGIPQPLPPPPMSCKRSHKRRFVSTPLITIQSCLQDPGPLSPLLSWTTPMLLPAQSPAVFHPPLDLWACRIVVPYAVSPPIGSIECHHSFLHALCWLQTLRYQLDCFHFAPTVEVCLFPWYRERMPTASEILLIFNCHLPAEVSTNTAPPVLPPDDFGLYFSQFCTVHPGVGWDTAFLEWFPRQLGGSSLAFVCEVPRSTPAPCFVVTTIAPGWIGGMMYAS